MTGVGGGLDHALVRTLRRRVGDELDMRRRSRRSAGLPALSGEDEQQLAHSLILDAIRDHAAEMLAVAQPPPAPERDAELARAVHAALYGAGRLQALLDRAEIENIDINGADEVWLGYADGSRERAAPVAESDEELVELVQVLAAHAGLNARPFDAANPELDLRLPDGSRLSAVMRASARPAVSVRRNRYPRVFLQDLVDNGTVSPELAGFLHAAVLARKNIMVAGATNAGKTTLLRALINAIPPYERLVTVENSLELGLRTLPDLHPDLVELEAVLPNSEGRGAVTMQQLVRRTLRMNPSRVIVGEVLGPEVVTMLNAMSQGNDGSLSTIHARSPRETFTRIATYAKQADERVDPETAHMLVAGALDLVVFVRLAPDTQLSRVGERPRVRRYVSDVLEVNGYDGAVLASAVFAAGPDGRAAVNPDATLASAAELAVFGYRHDSYGRDRLDQAWGA